MLFTLHGNGSTHHIHILLYDSHPQSNSMVLRSHTGIFLCKFLKNFFCKFLTHANTSIRNAVTHIYISIPALFLTLGFKCNRPSIRSEFYGIAQNIDQHIAQACRIRKYIWNLCIFTLNLKVDIPVRKKAFYNIQCRIGNVFHIRRYRIVFHFSTFDVGQI